MPARGERHHEADVHDAREDRLSAAVICNDYRHVDRRRPGWGHPRHDGLVVRPQDFSAGDAPACWCRVEARSPFSSSSTSGIRSLLKQVWVGDGPSSRPCPAKRPRVCGLRCAPCPRTPSPRADCLLHGRREVIDGRDAPVQAGPQGPQLLSERRGGRRVTRQGRSARGGRAQRVDTPVGPQLSPPRIAASHRTRPAAAAGNPPRFRADHSSSPRPFPPNQPASGPPTPVSGEPESAVVRPSPACPPAPGRRAWTCGARVCTFSQPVASPFFSTPD